MIVRRTGIVIMVTLWACGICLAQLDTATILGTVSDTSGAVIPNAKVAVQNMGTSATVELTTDSTGTFIAPALRIGKYKVTASVIGFKSFVQSGIQLNVNDRLNLSITLSPGAVTEEITVVGQQSVVETASTTLGAVVTTQQVVDLPLNGRSVETLTNTVPGTVALGNRAFSGAGEDRLWENATRYLVDGGDSSQVDSDYGFGGYASTARVNRVSVDAVSEFRMANNQYTAEYGAAVGGVINFITKSGTNEFHGTVFEFLRNERLDARNYFNPGPPAGQPMSARYEKPPLRLNQFGGTIGGPIVKHKLFFFADYEGVRQSYGNTFSTFTPTAAYRASITDPALLPALDMLPLPNGPVFNDPTCPDCVGEYVDSRVNTLRENSYMAKVDWQASSEDRFTFRHSLNRSFNKTYFGVGDGQFRSVPAHPQLANINYTRTLTPTLLNEFGTHLNRQYWDVPAGDDSIRQFPYVAFGSGVNPAGPAIWDLNVANTLIDFQDTLTWIKGRHQMKFGVQIARMGNNKQTNEQVLLFFLGLNGFLGSGFAGYSTNTPFLIYQVGWPRPSVRIQQNNFFVQDDIKVSKKLTLNLGLRYQYDGAPTEQYGRIANFDVRTGTLDAPGTTIYDAPKRNFGPRAGFAWTPFSSQKTVFRGGYGIYYANYNSADAQFLPTNVPGFGGIFSATIFDLPLTGFPATDISGSGFSPTGFNKDWQSAYTETWNFNIQQGFGQSTVFQVGYVGNRGLHFSTTSEANPIVPSTGLRRFPNFGPVNYYSAGLSTSYNALQVGLKRRWSSGLAFNVNYAWAKYLDDVGTSFGQAASAQDPNDAHNEWGPSDYDTRHVLEFDYTYALPTPRGMPAWLAGGWQVNGITILQSSQPFSILCGCDPTGIGASTARANQVPGVDSRPANYDIPSNQINSAAFVTPVGTGQFGTTGRNILRGPALLNTDFSLFKKFKVRESQTLEFRAEMFNLFNTPQFTNPAADISAPATFGKSLGTINSAAGFPSQRQIQFGLKYIF